MKTIKTRNTIRNINVLDKTVNLSRRMKDSFIKVKEKAEETQNSSHTSPTDYASNNVQSTTQKVAEETIHHLPTPRRIKNVKQKAADSFNRAKEHFNYAKNQMPAESKRIAEQAQKTAQTAKCNSIKLRTEAEQAFSKANEAKKAAREAKTALKEVKQTGRQAIKEIRLDTKQKIKFIKGSESNINQVGRGYSSAPLSKNMPLNKANYNTSKVVRINLKDNKIPLKHLKVIKSHNNIKQINNMTKKQPTLSQLNPFKRKTTQQKTTSAKIGTPFNKSVNIDSKLIKDTVIKPSYKSITQKTFNKTSQNLGSKTVKSTKKSIKATAKGYIKTAKRTAKITEKTAKKAVKTAEQTAKTAYKTAKAAAKTARTAEQAARVSAKVATQTAKAATRAVISMVKATIAALKGLVSLLIAGGWVVVLIIMIICMIGMLVGSIFGIFFSGEPKTDNSKTINMVIAEINVEYTAKIDGIGNANPHDLIDMSGARASWKQVLAVYTVKTVTDPDNPMEVATIDDKKEDILRTIFWEMNTVSHTSESFDVEEDAIGDDGLPTGETKTITKTVLRINVTHKTTDEMVVQYGFSDKQKEWLTELLKPEYNNLWNSLLYGVSTTGDGSMIEIADTQIGNVGGEPYWSWYGFGSRVEWCATFVSWVAEQCGYIEAGVIPRFSGCMNGVSWFEERGQWQDNTYTPRPGDIIFFDWESDGISDHVGIVESVENGKVNTIEGNTSDSVARRSYNLGSVKIYGYGVPVF